MSDMNSYFENVEESISRLRYRLDAFETEILLRGVFLSIVAYMSVGMAFRVVNLFVNVEPKTEPEDDTDSETESESSCADDSEEYSESESETDTTIVYETPQEVKNEPEYVQRILEDLETREASFSDISLS